MRKGSEFRPGQSRERSHRKLARKQREARAALPLRLLLPPLDPNNLETSLFLSSPLSTTTTKTPFQVHNESGSKRVVVTKGLPGDRWLKLLTDAGARVEVCTSTDTILSVPQIKSLIGDKCDGVIGQLTEVRGWR